MSRLGILLAYLMWPLAAMAEESPPETIVGALSQNIVSIDATFEGSEIFVFGAVKREAPIPEDAGALDVVIIVQGPSQRVVVRRKERVFGIWVNRDTVEIDEAPSFYAIASSAPLMQVMSETDRLRYRIGFDRAVRIVGAPAEIEEPRSFSEALVRIRQHNDLYTQNDGAVALREETLFNTSVALPANLVEGTYKARMFLLRNREVVFFTETGIEVRKTGLERIIYSMAQQQPLLYGVLSLVVALAAGWGASEIFRQLRR